MYQPAKPHHLSCDTNTCNDRTHIYPIMSFHCWPNNWLCVDPSQTYRGATKKQINANQFFFFLLYKENNLITPSEESSPDQYRIFIFKTNSFTARTIAFQASVVSLLFAHLFLCYWLSSALPQRQHSRPLCEYCYGSVIIIPATDLQYIQV